MKVDRLVSIIMILLEKERIGAQELAEMFEVSPRTIYRDIDAINMAGIPVRATSGVGGGFEIMQNFKMDRKVFSASDLSAILMGLTGLSSLIRGEELVNALAKVKSFIPADRAKEIACKANQISIDLSPWLGNRRIQPNMDTIKTAIEENRMLSFDYADRHGTRTARTAEPYQLVLKSSHWYWYGYCHSRNDFRLFKLARTSSLRVLGTSFTPRDYPKPQLDFSEQWEKMQIKITIRVHQSVLDRVLDYCAEEDCSPDGGEHYLVQFPFLENDYFYNVLFSFGDRCECLAPQRVREEMKRRIQDIAAIYER